MRPLDYAAAALAAVLTACAVQPPIPPPEPAPPIELPFPWEVGLHSEQALDDIATMLAAEWDRRRNEPELTLDDLVFDWVRQFCVLNGWPTPECGPPMHARIKAQIINRTE